MNQTFFYSILAVFLFLSFLIGRSSKTSKDSKDYFLGGRKVGLFQLTLTFLATQLGGGVILGTLEASYQYGLYSLLYGIGLSLGLIILSLGVGARFRRLNITTITEIFEKIYGSKRLREISALVSVVSLFLILVAICLSSQKLFFSLGFENKFAFTLFWLGTTYYTVMGGYKAVVKTDALQVGFILVSFVILSFFLFMEPFSFSLENFSVTEKTQDSFPWFSWLISPLFFVLIGQDMGQRCFSAHSEKTVSRACFYSAILLFLCTLLPCFLGNYAREAGLIASQETPLLLLSLGAFKNPLLQSVFTASVLMAILSTADSLLCAISSHLSEDFSFAKKKTNKQKLFFSRSVTLAVSMISLGFASFLSEIISLMILAYELSISLLFVPIIFSLFMKKPSARSAKISMLVGLISFIGVKFLPGFPGRELLPIVFGALSFVLTEKKEDEKKGTT